MLNDSLEKIIEQHELIEQEKISNIVNEIRLGEPKTHYFNTTLFLNLLVSKEQVIEGRLESVGILLDDVNFVIRYLDNNRLFEILCGDEDVNFSNLKRLLKAAH